MDQKTNQAVIESTKAWLIQVVIGNNFCPFARKVHVENRIRYLISAAETREQLLSEVLLEGEFLLKTPASEVDTSLLILPRLLSDFYDYNDFLKKVDLLLARNGLEGFIQVASFHPDYQFDGTEEGDISNYTNRSPYPMLHFLRESSVEAAIASYPEVEKIPDRNIQFLIELDPDAAKALKSFSKKNETK